MSHSYAKEGQYQGEAAILLGFGDYSAIMLPRMGGNLISLRHEALGYKLLREPEADEWDSFVQRPSVHGIPVLVPPNRYEDGKFTFDGREYSFPINEPATNNHLHGFVFNVPWDVADFGSSEERSFVTVKLLFDERLAGFAHFPHRFTISMTYTLDGSGLTQQVDVVNQSDATMPLMLGFHTAVNAPFAPGSSPDDVKLRLTIGQRWELSERMLPTGRTMPLSADEQRWIEGDGSPYCAALDNHYTAAPQPGRGNRMELTDETAGTRFVYDVGTQYKHWMVWNNKISRRYFCPEPQTNLVNAPNSTLPDEQTGLIALAPGASWSASSRMYVERV